MSQSSSRKARAVFIGRLLAGHVACYPMVFAACVFGMSLSIIAQKPALLALGARSAPLAETGLQRWLVAEVGLAPVEALSFELIMRPLAVLAVVIFVMTHIASVPWALAARAAALDPEGGAERLRRATRRFLIAVAVTMGSVVVTGSVGWLVIFIS